MAERIERIRRQLEQALHPSRLDIIDESERHIGHPGAESGGGHFSIAIISKEFIDKSLIERHRMVYKAVDDLLKSDIHALKIDARSPDEGS